MTAKRFEFDWLIVGSGFGGSVSALRLAEKGYRVGGTASEAVARVAKSTNGTGCEWKPLTSFA
jgi:succinate dehydrogenase/fumarate reductase flavoprotein subunit